jgi:hypothetical protein
MVALIMLLLIGGQWIYNNLYRDNLALLSSEQAPTAIASALPLGLFFLIMFALLGVGDMMHQLYLASDLELLMVAPVPYRTIFLVKLLQSSRATLIPALGYGAFLLAFGLAQDAVVSYYLLIVLLIPVAMILATAAVMILVILLARLFQPQQIRSWMPAVITLVTLVLLLSQQSATQWFLGQTDIITFLTEALLSPGQLSLVVAVLGGLALVTSLMAYQIFITSFYEGWNHLREVPTRRVSHSPATRRRWGVSRLLHPLPAPLRYFLIKEWLELRRNPRGLINFAQPLVLVVVVLVPFLSGGNGAGTLRPLIFWFMLAYMMPFLSTMPLGTSLMAIAQEGRTIVLLRSMPISMSDVLKGKFWATWVPTALCWVLVFLIAGIWLQFPPWQIGLLVTMAIWGLAGTSVATMAIGGVKVDFTAEELKQRIPTMTSYMMIGLNLIFVLLTVIAFVWLMIRLFPDSPDVLAIQALSGYPLIGWLFSTKPWFPFTILGGQLIFWTGVKIIWSAAVRRLESWEEI